MRCVRIPGPYAENGSKRTAFLFEKGSYRLTALPAGRIQYGNRVALLSCGRSNNGSRRVAFIAVNARPWP